MLLPFTSLLLAFLLGVGVDAGNVNQTRSVPMTNPSAFGVPAEPPLAEVEVGDPAPDFSYQGHDGRWMRLHHLVDQGPVLLFIGPKDADLLRLQASREKLLDLGVIPVAIVDRKPSQAAALSQRLGLSYTVLADPRLVIAFQFNAVRASVVSPSWFVMDRQGRVRDLGRGKLPHSDLVRLCAKALALPLPGTTFPSSSGAHGPPR